MFKGERYMTKGVQLEVPVVLQLFMWDCIRVVSESDYLQIFRLSEVDGKQKIVHELEIPAYKREYLLAFPEKVNEKVYVIDDSDHSTMLLSEEY